MDKNIPSILLGIYLKFLKFPFLFFYIFLFYFLEAA